MKTCYICGVSEEKALLYEGVAKEGFVNICRKCYVKNEIPLVEKKDITPETERKISVRERLVSMAGLKKEKFKVIDKSASKEQEDEKLNKILEKNFKENLPRGFGSYSDLVDNFHWIIMRKRRMQKLTQEQFAKKIFEPLIVIQHVEKGELPKKYYNLIKKIENSLGVFLFKEDNRSFEPSRIIGETKVASGITISDVKRFHEQEVFKKQGEIQPEELNLNKVEEMVGVPVGEEEEEKKEKRKWFSKKKKDEDISQEEIDKIVFGSGGKDSF